MTYFTLNCAVEISNNSPPYSLPFVKFHRPESLESLVFGLLFMLEKSADMAGKK